MTYPGGAGAQAFGSWPITSDPGPQSTRADPVAGIILLVAGVAGVAQLFLSWTSRVLGVGLPGEITGWQWFKAAKELGPADLGASIAAYSGLLVAVGGGALVLLALAMFAPINHRPLGAAGLLLSVAATGAALCWVLHNRSSLGGFGAMTESAELGWFLFLSSGLIGVIGSLKALATG